MINKFRTQYTTGSSLYILLYDEDQKVGYIAGETFETYGTGSRTAADYAINMTEVGSTGYYYASWPSWVSKGHYDVVVKIKSGSTPADSDTGFGPVEKYWTGSAATAPTDVDAVNICNRGLAMVGGGVNKTVITSLSDTDDTSVLCNLLYTPARKLVLKRAQPQECLYYAELTASSFSGEKAEWDYVYDLPSDCLQVISQLDEQWHRAKYPYEIKQSKLFTNTYSNEDGDAAYIDYVANETDASIFPEEIAEAIATKIAAELCPRIPGGEWGWKRRQELLREFETLALPNAMGINYAQQRYDEVPLPSNYSWLGDRWTSETYEHD